MATDYTLTNPSPEDFKIPLEGSDEDKNIISKQQLHLNLTSTPPEKAKQVLAKVKMKLQKNSDMLEVSMLWRTPALPFAITSMIFDVILMGLGGLIKFNVIPPQLPVFYNSFEQRWEQFDKSIVFIAPIFIFITEMLVIQFSIKIFRQDRRLSMVLCWILTLLNVLIFIIVTQIYSLVT